jgi:hypothetical protein
MMRWILLAFALGCSSGEQVAPIAPAPCASELDACDRDADCRNFSSCLSKCANEDDTCRTKCRADLPRGYNDLAVALQSCTARTCARGCGLSCGGYIAKTNECGACMRANCCAATSSCLADPSCAALQSCVRACRGFDLGCFAECEHRYPSAVTAARAAGNCSETACVHQCVPSWWRCLEDPAPISVATKTSFDLVLQASDYGSGKGRPGVRMRACSALDYKCETPLAEPAVSDDTGWATLRFKNPKDGVFDGYVEMEGTDLVPSIWFLGPIKHDTAQGILMVDVVTFAVLTNALGTPRDDRGHILITAIGCNSRNGSGVRYSLEPLGDAVGAYLVDKSPTKEAKMTDETGWGGFMNVLPNQGIKITATVVDFGLKFPEVTVFTRPGWIARVQLPAQPR